MKNSKEIFKALPENEKLSLIEKLMPNSGTYRQLENEGDFSDGQIEKMTKLFINSINWEQGMELEKICHHDKTCVVNGISKLGNNYEATGYYTDNEFLDISDLEIIM